MISLLTQITDILVDQTAVRNNVTRTDTEARIRAVLNIDGAGKVILIPDAAFSIICPYSRLMEKWI